MNVRPDQTSGQASSSGHTEHDRVAGRGQTLLQMLLSEDGDGDNPLIDWSVVLDRAQSCPSDAAERDYGTFTLSPLALAIDSRNSNPVPRDVLQAIIDGDPSAAMEWDETGALPLYWAAASEGLSADALDVVLRSYPAAASCPTRRNEMLPLHIVSDSAKARVLIDAWPRGTFFRSSDGRLPLHFAARYGSPDLVRMLVDEGLERGGEETDGHGGVMTPSDDGLSPLEVICDLIRCRTKVVDKKDGVFSSLDEAGRMMMDKFDICADAVVPCTKTNCVHAAVLLSCYPEVVWHAIEMNPVRLETRDGEGRLPLHIAAEKSDTPKEVFRVLLHKCWGRRQSTSAALDGAGRLPLALLALNRRVFDESFDLLVEAEPRALRVRDTPSGLFPYMLAAMGNDSALDTIYGLLLKDPSLVIV